MLHDPERTAALEALNGEIFRTLTVHLFNRAQSKTSESMIADACHPHAEQIQELLRPSCAEEPYFRALDGLQEWRERTTRSPRSGTSISFRNSGPQSADEIAFAHAMVELDKLLTLFHDRNRVLPGLSFERIWFLHSLRGPERMLQTRAVLGMLTAELAACTSA